MSSGMESIAAPAPAAYRPVLPRLRQRTVWHFPEILGPELISGGAESSRLGNAGRTAGALAAVSVGGLLRRSSRRKSCKPLVQRQAAGRPPRGNRGGGRGQGRYDDEGYGEQDDEEDDEDWGDFVQAARSAQNFTPRDGPDMYEGSGEDIDIEGYDEEFPDDEGVSLLGQPPARGSRRRRGEVSGASNPFGEDFDFAAGGGGGEDMSFDDFGDVLRPPVSRGGRPGRPQGRDFDDDDDDDEYVDAFDMGDGSQVFQGRDGMDYDDEEVEVDPLDEELSLLYDDVQLTGRVADLALARDEDTRALSPEEERKLAAQQKARQEAMDRGDRVVSNLEERTYRVMAEGIAVRTQPDERSPRTGEVLREGEEFTVVESQDSPNERDPRLYLKLPNGRGWVFDDDKVFPGFPSVKLVAVHGTNIEQAPPEPRPKPLIAIVGRPNVGKSSFVNRVADQLDINGAITFDEEGVTRDRQYRPATHTDDFGDTYLFDVVDTGGMIFEDDLENVTFKNEIKLQIDIALKQAHACIFVVDSQTGLVGEDYEIAKYLQQNYIKKGLKVVLAVAKCDRLETMDQHVAEFWALELGEPLPVCSLHGRGIWEVVDKIVDRGCKGLFPKRIAGEEEPLELRDLAVNVAICGKPNAGKSSLLNALVGEQRSIVSDQPGTTTDAVDAYLETSDGVYRFVDTAGVRRRGRQQVGTEWLAVNRAMKAVQRADVTLLVLDASEIRTGDSNKGFAYWAPDNQERYLARAIEERGSACVIVLQKWDAVAEKDERSQTKFIEAVRSNLAGVGQWAEVVTCSARSGQRLKKILQAIDKTLAAHKKKIPTPVLNEIVRDALLWKLPPAKAYNKKQGRIYYATQVSSEPPTIALFVNHPKLFGPNYVTYLENKLRQDLGWFGTPMRLDFRKRSERKAVSEAEQWLAPRLQPDPVWR
eukprot:TRINITY_DN184_c1_g1_i1.p1 TRINITY_DN184_c1_g1~~TRINITY_DN184_c1_g1_i1.p1  ORF type:complete len:947 (-),score=256.25 TRINITY_DN184_c1_g1_i1:346-3129(-)